MGDSTESFIRCYYIIAYLRASYNISLSPPSPCGYFPPKGDRRAVRGRIQSPLPLRVLPP